MDGQIVPITQNAEKSVGADFEIWMRIPSGKYLAYSVQAKKVKLGTLHHSYEQLNEGGAAGNDFQYDTLLRHAWHQKAIAMHVFYNGWPITARSPYADRRCPRVYGCAAVRTADVKRLREQTPRRNNKVSNFEPASMPWSSLFRRPPWKTPSARRRRWLTEAVAPSSDGLTELARWMQQLPGDEDVVLPTSLPVYVSSAMDRHAGQELQDDPGLPRFALVANLREEQ